MTTLENAIAPAPHRSRFCHFFPASEATGKTTAARIMLARCLNCIHGPTATPLRRVSPALPWKSAVGKGASGRHRNRRGIESRHQRDARVARKRPLSAGARSLQSIHRGRSASDHQRGVQRSSEDAGGAAGVGGFHSVHHGIAQNSGDHRVALPAVQFSIRRFRAACRAHAMDRAAGRHHRRCRDVQRACASGRGQRSRFAVGPGPGDCLLRNGTESSGGAGACWACSRSICIGMVAKALADADSRAMLDVVADLEANGRSLQHFSRELARYFRTLLVVKISRGATKLVAASPPEQEALGKVAAQFSEEDPDALLAAVARFIPRICVKLLATAACIWNWDCCGSWFHAGKLQSIEEAIAGIGSAPAPSVKPAPSTPPAPIARPAPIASPAPIQGGRAIETPRGAVGSQANLRRRRAGSTPNLRNPRRNGFSLRRSSMP